MNSTIELQKLKDCYKEFLYTEDGKWALQQAIKCRKELKEMNSVGKLTTTKNVNINLNKRLKNIVKLTIIPIGLNNLCHTNSQVFEKCGYESQVGLNITSCDCGKFTSYELHTINKKDGVYYDFTIDFGGETEKYFYPLDTTLSIGHINQLILNGDLNYFYNCDGCKKCSYKSNKNNTNKISLDEFLNRIDFYKKVKF